VQVAHRAEVLHLQNCVSDKAESVDAALDRIAALEVILS
jgi:hypothetical protein